MDPQFYAFLSSLWGVFNSNFWAALAGAFAGAVAASRFAARQEVRDDLERKINAINAAISIAYSACEAYITHKEGLIDRLANAYRSEMAAYNEAKQAQQSEGRDISLSLMESTVLVVQCSALQELVFRIPERGHHSACIDPGSSEQRSEQLYGTAERADPNNEPDGSIRPTFALFWLGQKGRVHRQDLSLPDRRGVRAEQRLHFLQLAYLRASVSRGSQNAR